MTFPFGESVTLHSRSGSSRDGDGNSIPTWTDRVVKGCAFAPGGSVELVQGQDLLTVQPTVYLPAMMAVKATDQITVRGDRFEVDGSPNDWRNPYTGWLAGIAVKLKAVTG